MLLLMISPMFSCDEEKSGEDEINPMALLLLLGNNTLTVNVTYEGAWDVEAASGTRAEGSGYIYVCLFNTMPGANTTSPSPVYIATNSVKVTNTDVQTITINGIWSGNYYIMVFFDYRGSKPEDTDPIQQNERYELYNTSVGSNCVANATPISIPDTSSIDITFNDDYTLDSGGGGGGGPKFETICLP